MPQALDTPTKHSHAILDQPDVDAPEKVLSVGLPNGHWFLVDIVQHEGAATIKRYVTGSLTEAMRLSGEAKEDQGARIRLCDGEPLGSPQTTFLEEVLEVHRGATTFVLRLVTGKTVCYSACHIDEAGRRLERLTQLHVRQLWPVTEE